MLKLLSLVSFKIYQRFRNLREAFRYIDTDHSQSISINEFAQAIDYFRLKISFDDINKLYRYLDSDGSGEIGYDEFTLLSEERWRNIDPYKHYQEGQQAYKVFKETQNTPQSSAAKTSDSDASKMGIRSNDAAGYQQLEDLSKHQLKIPIMKQDKDTGFVNINRSDPSTFVSQSQNMFSHGRPSEPTQKMTNVIRHDYLRKSMVDRVDRKNLMKQYRDSQIKVTKDRFMRPTKTQ